MNYTPSPHVLQRLASRQAPADEPCTGEPARAAVAQVVTTMARNEEATRFVFELCQVAVELVDFYKLEAA